MQKINPDTLNNTLKIKPKRIKKTYVIEMFCIS